MMDWIPVTERLPHEGVNVLVSSRWDDDVAVARVSLNPDGTYGWIVGTAGIEINGDAYVSTSRDFDEFVEAWMPLPLPAWKVTE